MMTATTALPFSISDQLTNFSRFGYNGSSKELETCCHPTLYTLDVVSVAKLNQR